jgi:trimethylamine monooxygenase
MKGGNKKLLYVGVQDQYYTFTMFDCQAKWVVQYLMGEVKLPSRDEMLEDINKWTTR